MLICNSPDNQWFLRHVLDRALPGYHYPSSGVPFRDWLGGGSKMKVREVKYALALPRRKWPRAQQLYEALIQPTDSNSCSKQGIVMKRRSCSLPSRLLGLPTRMLCIGMSLVILCAIRPAYGDPADIFTIG